MGVVVGTTPGVSVVICCHQGAARLPATLDHLANQRFDRHVPWEVVLVDNASSDGTREVALTRWSRLTGAPLRVVDEPRLGVAWARETGLRSARHTFVSFVDDDNHVDPRFVETVFDVMSRHPEAGACAGHNTQLTEGEVPPWFRHFANAYAVGTQGTGEHGDVTERRRYFWGAGLTLRRSAWEELQAAGFTPMLASRQGRGLRSGDDGELCFALQFAGWRLYYDSRIRLHHYLPPSRLRLSYLRRLMRGSGRTNIGLRPYRVLLHPEMSGEPRSWRRDSLEALRRTAYWALWALRARLSGRDGVVEEMSAQRALGQLLELLARRNDYERSFESVAALRDRLAAHAAARAGGSDADRVRYASA